MHAAIRARQQTFVPTDGSRTLTITNVPTQDDSDEEQLNSESDNIVGSLQLRGGHRRTQRVAWGSDVIDNEGCGKKKSKICCIYHKPRRFDESSSEESSDSDSENQCRHGHNHSPHSLRLDGPSSGGSALQIRDGSPSVASVEHDPKSNAYEKQPHSKKGKRRAA